MTNMPTAITLLLPVITADAGQGRADTLQGPKAQGYQP